MIFFFFFIPMCNSDPGLTQCFFSPSEGKAFRKAWYRTWKRDFWQSRIPTNKYVLAHSWIFLCCSGTWCYVIPESRARPVRVRVYRGGAALLVLTKVSPLIFLPFLFLSHFEQQKPYCCRVYFYSQWCLVSSSAVRQAQLGSWVPGARLKPNNTMSEIWRESNGKKLSFYSYFIISTEHLFRIIKARCLIRGSVLTTVFSSEITKHLLDFGWLFRQRWYLQSLKMRLFVNVAWGGNFWKYIFIWRKQP